MYLKFKKSKVGGGKLMYHLRVIYKLHELTNLITISFTPETFNEKIFWLNNHNVIIIWVFIQYEIPFGRDGNSRTVHSLK